MKCSIVIKKRKRNYRKDSNKISGIHVHRAVAVYGMKDKPAWNPLKESEKKWN